MTKDEITRLREIAHKQQKQNQIQRESDIKLKKEKSEQVRKAEVDKLLKPILKAIEDGAPKGLTHFRFNLNEKDFDYARGTFAQVRSFTVTADLLSELQTLGLDPKTRFEKYTDYQNYDPEITYNYFLEIDL